MQQTLLSNHKPEPHVRCSYLSPPRWLRGSLYTVPCLFLSLVGCISSSYAIGTQRDRRFPEASVVQDF
uniref:Lipoprotein n=1 Tax=Mesocestoides corti TaxID=53468 RepID=A0A5K3ETP7_MESCO